MNGNKYVDSIFVKYKQRCKCNNFKLKCYKKEQERIKYRYKDWLKEYISEMIKKGSSTKTYKQIVWIARCNQCNKLHIASFKKKIFLIILNNCGLKFEWIK